MQLLIRCEGCGRDVVVFVGDPSQIAFDHLPRVIAEAHDSHRCPREAHAYRSDVPIAPDL